MKRIFLTLVAILLLSGCTVDPAALALIPTPLPESPSQPCESGLVVRFVSYQGPDRDILIYFGGKSVDNAWLHDWAEDAIARDGGKRMLEAFWKDANSIIVTVFYMNLFLDADRFCLENRKELAALIETFAVQYRDRE